jgi:prepilin-type N-terminal cleavage/methylation domain-containing protein
MKASKGFTLIEVIVAIIIIAIASVLFLKYMSKSFTNSPLPVGLVSNQYSLIQQMELFNDQYRQQIVINNALSVITPIDLAAFKATYIDGKPFVDAANTTITTMTSNGSGYTTQNTVLVVTLKNGDQTLQTIFTQ